MGNLKQTVPLMMVKDLEATLEFYVKGLGFELKLDWKPQGRIEWCWLERDEVALMFQEYREGSLPAEKRGIGISLNIICKDSLAIYHELKEKGLTMEEPFVGNRMWVVALSDPDGYAVNFESLTEVAEGTKYSELIV